MPAGDIEHLGRADSEVKVRGNRVDLQEIESVMRAPTSGMPPSWSSRSTSAGTCRTAQAGEALTSTEQPERSTLRLGGATVATGWSEPAGRDPSSGLDVHVVDFSAVSRSGDGFELEVGGALAQPFAIRSDLYASLRTDAMRFLHGNRSEIAIEEDIAGAGYGRGAGHVVSSPGGGDTAVPCQEPRGYADGWTCDYELDVSGGWYDAGDLGKYVVNGGIATWLLMSTWERAVHSCTSAVKLISTSCPGCASRGVTRMVETTGVSVPKAARRTAPATANALSMSRT